MTRKPPLLLCTVAPAPLLAAQDAPSPIVTGPVLPTIFSGPTFAPHRRITPALLALIPFVEAPSTSSEPPGATSITPVLAVAVTSSASPDLTISLCLTWPLITVVLATCVMQEDVVA